MTLALKEGYPSARTVPRMEIVFSVPMDADRCRFQPELAAAIGTYRQWEGEDAAAIGNRKSDGGLTVDRCR